MKEERGPCDVLVMLSGATVGVGEGSTEASFGFSSFFCTLMRGLQAH